MRRKCVCPVVVAYAQKELKGGLLVAQLVLTLFVVCRVVVVLLRLYQKIAGFWPSAVTPPLVRLLWVATFRLLGRLL